MAPSPARRIAGSPAAKAVEARYAAATQAASEAFDRVVETSAARLADLLRARAEARFAALADPASVLTPEDRGRLLQSLRGSTTPARPIPATTASRLAIWRSRLPYRVVPLSVRVIAGLAVLGFGLLAWHRTPERWVTVAGAQPLPTQWLLPDGGHVEGGLKPGERYVLLRRDGEAGLLRSWLAERGYAETRAPLSALRESR